MKKKKLITLISVIFIVIILVVLVTVLKKPSKGKDSLEIVNGIKIEHSSYTSLLDYLNDKIDQNKLDKISTNVTSFYKSISEVTNLDYEGKVITTKLSDGKISYYYEKNKIYEANKKDEVTFYNLDKKGVLILNVTDDHTVADILNDNLVTLASKIEIDNESTPVLIGNELYYGTANCKGQRSDGTEGPVIEVFVLNFEKIAINKIANLDNKNGMKC